MVTVDLIILETSLSHYPCPDWHSCSWWYITGIFARKVSVAKKKVNSLYGFSFYFVLFINYFNTVCWKRWWLQPKSVTKDINGTNIKGLFLHKLWHGSFTNNGMLPKYLWKQNKTKQINKNTADCPEIGVRIKYKTCMHIKKPWSVFWLYQYTLMSGIQVSNTFESVQIACLFFF